MDARTCRRLLTWYDVMTGNAESTHEIVSSVISKLREGNLGTGNDLKRTISYVGSTDGIG